jgi:hypothetical protein
LVSGVLIVERLEDDRSEVMMKTAEAARRTRDAPEFGWLLRAKGLGRFNSYGGV